MVWWPLEAKRVSDKGRCGEMLSDGGNTVSPESSHRWCSHPSRTLADPSITAVGEKNFKIGASQPHLRLRSEAQPGSEAAVAAELSSSKGKRSHTQPGCASGHSDGAPATIPCGPEGQRVSVRGSQGSSLEQTSAQSKTRCPVGISKDQDTGGKTPSWQPGAHGHKVQGHSEKAESQSQNSLWPPTIAIPRG